MIYEKCRILKLRKFDRTVVIHYQDRAQEFARRGFRSLGVAVKEEGKDWELLGIMSVIALLRFICEMVGMLTIIPFLPRSMSDPPRADTAATIAEAQDLGIHIKMLTGDAVRRI